MTQVIANITKANRDAVAAGWSAGVLRAMTEQSNDDSRRWFGIRESSIEYNLIALGGEVGELQNVYKKVMRGSMLHTEAQPELASEMADILVYLVNLAGLLGIDLEEEYHRKRAFNESRFGPQGSKA